jgi:hypothetical protein
VNVAHTFSVGCFAGPRPGRRKPRHRHFLAALNDLLQVELHFVNIELYVVRDL